MTGLCECVSVAGPLLGGGHSLLQARHGFSADNLVSARVVLANGSAVTASAAENPDLFWALRGAGHNFGIATSLELKLYDAAETWTMIFFVFTQDKLERVLETWNQLEAQHDDPGLLLLNGVIARNPAVDAEQPVINLQLFYGGENAAAPAYEAAFHALGPASSSTVADIAYGDVYRAGGFDLAGPVCRKNQNILGYPNSFSRWDTAAMRAAFEVFAEVTAIDAFATSIWLLESYGARGIKAVPVGENAVAPEERSLHILTSPIFWWVGDDSRDRERAVRYGERMQEEARRGSGDRPHVYLNYAVGTEELGEVYGRDGARLARLRRLKKEYDPHNRFGFYNPIR